MRLVLTTAPADLMLTTAEAKLHLKVDDATDDALIAGLVKAATSHIENAVLHRSLINRTYDLYTDDFPNGYTMELPMPPLSSVTSVKYTDTANVEQTWAATNYKVVTTDDPGKIFAKSFVFPLDLYWLNAVHITFVAGYGAAYSNVPFYDDVQTALKLIIGEWYEYRENINEKLLRTIPNGAMNILMPWRYFR